MDMDMPILDKIHQINLELLKEFDRIASKHQVRYFIGYGTLLGAVRHKDFIPWDNDVDIMLPREDFDRIMKILPAELNWELYELVTPSDFGTHYRDLVPFISYKKAHIKVDPAFDDFYLKKASTITLDLFVLDKTPVGIRGKIFTARLEARCGLLNAYRYDFNYDGYKGVLKVAAFFLYHLGKCMNPLKIERKIDRIARKYEKNSSVLHYSVTNDNFRSYAYRVPVSDFGDGAPYTIGNETFMGPENPEKLLSQYYGPDYMTPPPPEEQVPHLAILETTGDDLLTEDKFIFDE